MRENPVGAVKFLVIAGIKGILVIKVTIHKKLENTVSESFDNSQEFLNVGHLYQMYLLVKIDLVKCSNIRYNSN